MTENEAVDLVKSVLVVVDVQNGFVSSKSAPVVPRVIDVVRRWEELGGATLFTTFVNYPESPYERLIHWSRMHEPPEIDIVGIATDSCVLKTACDAFERGLTPWVVTDAVFSHAGQEPHEAGLPVTGRFIGRHDADTLFAEKLIVTA